MVAVVELPRQRARRIERAERQHFDAGLTHRLEECRGRRHAADRVVEHAHFDASLAAADQQLAQRAPDVVVREDVRFEMHVMLRILDGDANRAQRLRTVHQQRDTIAGDERRGCALAECIDHLADVLGLVTIVEPLLDYAFARARRQRSLTGHDGRFDALGGLPIGKTVRGRCAGSAHQEDRQGCEETAVAGARP